MGYFVAEGSYVKEVVVQGEENEYAVRCHICNNLYNNLSAHIHNHGITWKKYLKKYPGSKCKAEKSLSFIKASRKESLDKYGLKKLRKYVGLEFSLGEHEYNTVNKEIVSLAKKIFTDSSVLRYKKAVKIISPEAASFMLEYCGEYSNKKKLTQKVL